MRRRKKMMYGMIAAAVCAFGGCGKPDTFPHPIQPESLVSDLVTEEKDSYEISGLNWDMSMAEAERFWTSRMRFWESHRRITANMILVIANWRMGRRWRGAL